MICKLCLEEKQLIKKSHIIPDFMYKGIYDEKHKIVHINLENIKNKSHTYSGIYDKNILCANCDNEIISKLETYASNCVYFNGSLKSRSHIEIEKFEGNEDFVPFVRLKNLDYLSWCELAARTNK